MTEVKEVRFFAALRMTLFKAEDNLIPQHQLFI